MSFICEKCNKQLKDKYSLDRHYNRKYPCDQLPNIDVDNECICPFCNKKYSSRSTLNRHLKDNCKKIDKKVDETCTVSVLKKKIKKLEKGQYELLKKNKELEKKINTDKVIETIADSQVVKGNYNNNCNNTTNNTTNNIFNIVAFGKEDLSHLSKKDWIKIFKNNYKAMEALTKLTHFDEDKPENHNIYIAGQKSKYAMVHNGKDWELKDRNDTVGDLYGDKAYIIFNKIDELSDELPVAIVDKFNKIREDYDNDKIEKTMVKSLDTLLLNNRKIAIATTKGKK